MSQIFWDRLDFWLFWGEGGFVWFFLPGKSFQNATNFVLCSLQGLYLAIKKLNSNTASFNLHWEVYPSTNSKTDLWLCKIRSKAFASCCSLELIRELVTSDGNKQEPQQTKPKQNPLKVYSDASSMELCPKEFKRHVHKIQILLLTEVQGDKRSRKSGGKQTFHKICRLQPSHHVSVINLKAIFNFLM